MKWCYKTSYNKIIQYISIIDMNYETVRGVHPLKCPKIRFQDSSLPKRTTEWANFLIGFGAWEYTAPLVFQRPPLEKS